MLLTGAWYLFLISLSSLLPAVLGSEFGFRRLYIKLLVDLFDWATDRIVEDNNEEVELEDNHNHDHETTADIGPRSRVSIGGLPRNNSFDMRIIEKQTSVQSMRQQNCRIRRESTMEKPEHIQIAEDAMFFMSSGVEAIIDDDVTQCFRPEQLSGWNLLARTNCRYQFMSVRLTCIWFVGVIFRWFFLMPWRVSVTFIGCIWMIISMTIAALANDPTERADLKSRTGWIPKSLMSWVDDEETRLKAAYWANIVTYRIFTRALGAIVNYHNRENLPQNGSICVANHTTVIDTVTLSNDRPYALIGQSHGGLLGWFQRRLARCTKHVWFERSELRDRKAVGRRLMEHTKDTRNYPCLIFPEGTCINNTSVMQFKKGSFEASDTIYPVAIKYNPWFGDAFYNSSKFGMAVYLLRVFTSWAIVAEVYYLPKMVRGAKEDPIDFADRCKSAIARAGGLVDRVWDGNLKRSRVKPDQVDRIRGDYYEIIKRRPWFRNEEHSESQDSIIQKIVSNELVESRL